MQGVGGEVGTMHFYGGKTVKRFSDLPVGNIHGIVKCFAFDHLGDHGTGGYGGATPEGLEFDIRDFTFVHLYVYFHDVAAGGITDFSYPVGIGNLADIAWISKVIHDLFAVHLSTSEDYRCGIERIINRLFIWLVI